MRLEPTLQEANVPQVWLTYEELGEMMNWEPSQVRRAIVDCDWPRKRSRDGQTRIKLSPTLAHEFMINYAVVNGGESFRG